MYLRISSITKTKKDERTPHGVARLFLCLPIKLLLNPAHLPFITIERGAVEFTFGFSY